MAAICYNHFWAFAICYILLNGLCYMLLHTPWGALFVFEIMQSHLVVDAYGRKAVLCMIWRGIGYHTECLHGVTYMYSCTLYCSPRVCFRSVFNYFPMALTELNTVAQQKIATQCERGPWGYMYLYWIYFK